MSKRILLADDSVTIRKVVELTFMDESFDLISVGSGSEALDRLNSDIDLVIADVHMPGADGYEVCEEVKKRSSATPVLLLVGTFESYDESRAAEAGADEHLKKPFDSQDLLGRVHSLLAKAEGEGEGEEPEPIAAEAEESHDRESWQAVSATAAEVEIEDAAVAEPESFDSVDDEEMLGAAGATDGGAAGVQMSDELVDRIARRVVELLSEEAIREVAWEVIPDLAEVVIKERLNQLESQVE
ncbi:MAG: response regulator transcription factor [bacterium]|nr:response regulator transcription factor [bacterium]